MYDMSLFGRAFGAAGVEGFFGEGHPHYSLPFRRPNCKGSTFVSKTATLHPRHGNVKGGFWEWLFPSWAKAKFFSGHTLNAMGLPNIGIKALLACQEWQKRTEPFFISIMSVESTPEKRLEELHQMVDSIGQRKSEFSAPFGLQINLSCPNTGHNLGDLIEESAKALDVASALSVPLVPKYAIDTAPITAVVQLSGHPHCDGICVSNTLKYNYRGLGKKIWGKEVSPLEHLGGGGISGPALLPLVCEYIKALRDAGFEKNINGGGGIFCPEDVDAYRDAGADSIFVGTVATHHPRRVAGIIRRADTLTWRKT